MRQNEASRETRKKDKLEKEMKQLQTELDAKMTEVKTIQQNMHRNKEELLRVEQQLKEQKVLQSVMLKLSQEPPWIYAKLRFMIQSSFLLLKVLIFRTELKALGEATGYLCLGS